MWTSKIEGLKECSLFFKVIPFLAKPKSFAYKRCQGLTESKIDTFNKYITDFFPQLNQSLVSIFYVIICLYISPLLSSIRKLFLDQIRVISFYWDLRKIPPSCSGRDLYLSTFKTDIQSKK